MSFLEWYGQFARDFACAVDNFVPSLLAEAYGDQVAEGYLSALDLFAPSPCPGVPELPPPPGEGTLPNPNCGESLISYMTFSTTRPGQPVLNKIVLGRVLGWNRNAVDWGINYIPNGNVTAQRERIIVDEGGEYSVSLQSYRVTDGNGNACPNTPNQPRPPQPFPEFPPGQPIIVTPPPPLPQVPLALTFQIHAPITISNTNNVQIPITGTVNFANSVSVPITIPFTLDLPDFNANFAFAFNPYFTAVTVNGQLRNWPPPGSRPDTTAPDCPDMPELPKPLFKIEERIVGAYVYWDVNLLVRGKTLVPRPGGGFNDSIYPRYGHLQFVNGDVFGTRSASAPVTERFGYVACPFPEGASEVIFNPEPGFTGASVFAVRRPVAIPIRENGSFNVALEAV